MDPMGFIKVTLEIREHFMKVPVDSVDLVGK